jgi:hypothetical protein
MSVDGEVKEKTKKKKTLTKANKLRIGSSTQERMKIDPRRRSPVRILARRARQ